MEPMVGFEPTTYSLQNCRSNQLSYGGLILLEKAYIKNLSFPTLFFPCKLSLSRTAQADKSFSS